MYVSVSGVIQNQDIETNNMQGKMNNLGVTIKPSLKPGAAFNGSKSGERLYLLT